MNKKIAFCFSGQARTFDLTHEYFKKNLFDAAKDQGFQYDIFCAVEDDIDVEKVELMRPTKVKKIKSSEVQIIIENKYGKFIKESFNKKYYFYQTHKYSIINGLQQFYKIYISNNLKNQYSLEKGINYDIVVKLRFDIVFLNKINFRKILELIDNSIILNKIPNTERFIYDHFAFGNNKNMDIYTNTFVEFRNIFNKEITGFKKKFINYIDNILQIILKLLYKILFRGKLIHAIVEKLFFLKLLFLIRHGFFYYNYESIVYENIVNNKIHIHNGCIDFLLIRGNLSDNPTVLLNGSEFEI